MLPPPPRFAPHDCLLTSWSSGTMASAASNTVAPPPHDCLTSWSRELMHRHTLFSEGAAPFTARRSVPLGSARWPHTGTSSMGSSPAAVRAEGSAPQNRRWSTCDRRGEVSAHTRRRCIEAAVSRHQGGHISPGPPPPPPAHTPSTCDGLPLSAAQCSGVAPSRRAATASTVTAGVVILAGGATP